MKLQKLGHGELTTCTWRDPDLNPSRKPVILTLKNVTLPQTFLSRHALPSSGALKDGNSRGGPCEVSLSQGHIGCRQSAPVPSPEGCDPSVSAIFKKAVQVLSKSEMVTDNGSVIVFFVFVYISGKKCKIGQ